MRRKKNGKRETKKTISSLVFRKGVSAIRHRKRIDYGEAFKYCGTLYTPVIIFRQIAKKNWWGGGLLTKNIKMRKTTFCVVVGSIRVSKRQVEIRLRGTLSLLGAAVEGRGCRGVRG